MFRNVSIYPPLKFSKIWFKGGVYRGKPADIIWLVCRGVTIFLLTQISRSGKPCRYVEHMRKVHRKVSRGLWKKTFNLKNAKETQNVVQKFWQNLIFLVETFFQRCLQNFLSVWRMCSRYLQGPPDLHLCVSKKSGTARHTNNKISTKKGAVKNFHKVHVLRNFWQFGPNINWRKVRKIVSNHRCVKSWGNVVWLLLKVR